MFSMKKWFFPVVAAVVCTAFNASAQTLITQVKPAGSKFWGYANIKGEIIIPAQFQKCFKFSGDGWATVFDEGRKMYQFINPKGERMQTEVLDFKLHDGMFTDPEGFVNGLIDVRVGEKWGYINTNGKIAIPAKYDDVSEFNGGYAVAKTGATYMVLNTAGEEKIVQGAVVSVNRFQEGMAPFKSHDKRFGFVDTDGKIAIPAQYESVGFFSNGLAWAKTGKSVGYINKKGEWAIPPTFSEAKEFDAESGLARIKTATGMWAYTNSKGELTYMNDTETYGDFSNGLADGKKNGLKGFYDTNGKWVIQPQYENVRNFKNGYAAARTGGKWGIIDTSGKWVIQPMFEGIKDMELVK